MISSSHGLKFEDYGLIHDFLKGWLYQHRSGEEITFYELENAGIYRNRHCKKLLDGYRRKRRAKELLAAPLKLFKRKYRMWRSRRQLYIRGDARLPHVIMPMINRVFPELIAAEIVGVQPMDAPVDGAFKLLCEDGEDDNAPRFPELKYPKPLS